MPEKDLQPNDESLDLRRTAVVREHSQAVQCRRDSNAGIAWPPHCAGGMPFMDWHELMPTRWQRRSHEGRSLSRTDQKHKHRGFDTALSIVEARNVAELLRLLQDCVGDVRL